MTERFTGSARRARSPRGGAAIALALSMTALGCGNVTSGGLGEVEVVLAPDELETLGANVQSLLASTVEAAPGDSIRGSLTVRVRSFARRPGGTFEELTDGPQDVTVSLVAPEPVEIARRQLSAGRYDGVRTFFSRIEVDVTDGLVVDGVPVQGTVTVDLGTGGALTVLDETVFEVDDGAPTVIALEMQTRVWLRLVDAVARRVDVTDFRRIFRIRLRKALSP